MFENFVDFRCSAIGDYSKKDPQNRGKFVIPFALHLEFLSFAEREIVLQDVFGQSGLKIARKAINMKCGSTREATMRHNALRDADRLLSSDARLCGQEVKRVMSHTERGVTVNGAYAFSQGQSGIGSFRAPYNDLRLPGRRP